MFSDVGLTIPSNGGFDVPYTSLGVMPIAVAGSAGELIWVAGGEPLIHGWNAGLLYKTR